MNLLNNDFKAKGLTRFKTRSVVIQEVWFDEELESISDTDVIHYYQRSHPISGISFNEFYTMVIDLKNNQDELWRNLGKTERYEIKRAIQKDQISYRFWKRNEIDSTTLNSFFEFYDKFALSQKLGKIPRSRIQSYMDAGILNLSCVSSDNGEPLVWHTYCCINNRACFVYSASIRNSENSTYQRMIGRANRYHHWQDILKLRELGFSTYDFGGWYAGQTNQKLLNINEFKKGFGGEIIQNFKSLHGLTLKGKLCAFLYKMLH